MKKFLSILLLTAMVLSAVSCASSAFTSEKILSANDVTALAAETANVTIKAIDAAYIRSGRYQNDNFKDTEYYFIKNDGVDTTRHVMVKYDISSLKLTEEDSVSLVITFFSVSPIHPDNPATEIKLWAYGEHSNWSSDTVTFATFSPLDEANFLGDEYLIKNEVYINITDYVKAAAQKGEKTVSVRLVPSTRTVAEMRVYTLSSNFAPKLVVTKAEKREYYQPNILNDQAANKELWDYAKQVYDSWKARYDEIVAKGDYSSQLIASAQGDYTFTTEARQQNYDNKTVAYNTRLATTLKGYTPNTEEVKFDKYGGVISDTRFEATGFFYTKKADRYSCGQFRNTAGR